jgi:aminomethyltransferase
MGRLEVTGPDREALVNRVFSGRTAKLDHGRAKYGFLLNEAGYPIDDVLIYRDVDVMHVVINATGRDTDPDWVRRQNEKSGFDAQVRDVSDDQAMIALQGPASEMTLQPLCGADLSAPAPESSPPERTESTPGVIPQSTDCAPCRLHLFRMDNGTYFIGTQRKTIQQGHCYGAGPSHRLSRMCDQRCVRL